MKCKNRIKKKKMKNIKNELLLISDYNVPVNNDPVQSPC